MKFVLASNNSGKLTEMREILAPLGIELLSQSEAGGRFTVDETGTTFEENAYLKAVMATALLGMPAIADDSGLCVDALNGQPGVHSARYGGPACESDRDRVELLLKNMEGQTDRRARFVSCICCTFPNGDRIEARGECEGELLTYMRGEGGFGYDPIFVPTGSDRTMAELTMDEKNAISHRGKSLEELRKGLREYYAADE